MILFNFFINIIEAFIFPIFLSHYFRLPHKKKLIVFSGSTQLFILSIFSLYFKSNYILTLLIIISNLLSIYIITKKVSFNNVYITILYNIVIIMTSIFGLYLQFIIQVLGFIYTQTELYVISCVAAKIVLIIITFLLVHFKTKLSVSLEMKKWKLVLSFEAILLISIVTVGYLIVTTFKNNISLYFLLFLLVMMNFFFIFIIYEINKLNNDNLRHYKEKQIQKFENQKVVAVKNIKAEIDSIDHKLFYVIFQIDNLLSIRDYKQIHILLDRYKSMVLKHRMVIDSGNSVFDCLISLKINDLIIRNIDVKTCIFISQNKIYDDLKILDLLKNILDYFYDQDSIIINIEEINGFVRIRISTQDEITKTNEISMLLNKEIDFFDGKYILEEKQLRVIFKLEREDD